MTSPVIAIVKNGKIELLNPLSFPEGTQLLVTPIPSDNELETIETMDELSNLSLQGLNLAYDENEPEYTLEQIKEFNPDYEGG
ncbi:MAG TPA: glycosyl hydrolase family 31 [Cyanothece sp. UBA12306]|nr:glycosyl hydrolase family 31 [Cyanothece sp. UBA12306]